MSNPPPLPSDYVGFWKRLFASLVDSVLILLLLTPPLIWIYGWEYFTPTKTELVSGLADLLITWVVPILLVFGFWIVKRATPGKMVLSAEILDAKTSGAPTLSQWILRYLGYFVSLIPFGLGFLWIGIDPRKQGWHDKIARTVVVRRDRSS